MDDTTELRNHLLKLWKQFDKGELSPTEARVHIGFARTVIETLKVEIAAAHLGHTMPAAVAITDRATLKIGKRKTQ